MPKELSVTSIHQKYPRETAGSLMVTNIPVAKPSSTIKDVKDLIVKKSKEYESINYIYIVDHTGKLTGVISVKDVFQHPENTVVSEIMDKELYYAHPYTHQEKVAFLSLKHEIKAIPVIDKEKNFLGVVPNGTILSVMHEETSENLLKFVGMHNQEVVSDDIMHLSVKASLIHRLPWIVIGLFGGILIAETMGFFEETLSEHIVLAAFVPLMVYISNAIGQQVSAFLIRDTAIYSSINYVKYFLKHTWIVLLLSIILAAIIFAYTALVYQDINLAKVLSAALFGTTISSIITGFGIPYIFIKLKQDPANATGPISTIVQDFVSVIIYLTIAVLLIS
jgi:magnesium transporter